MSLFCKPDHGIDLTESSDAFGTADILIPEDDNDIFRQAGCTHMVFSRSHFLGEPRQQVNMITSFIDGSAIYGSAWDRATELRTLEGGRLKTSSDGQLLPFNINGFPNAGGNGNPALVLAGDIRAKEQAGLTAMHTLFVREHNRLAQVIQQRFKSATDDEISLGAQIGRRRDANHYLQGVLASAVGTVCAQSGQLCCL